MTLMIRTAKSINRSSSSRGLSIVTQTSTINNRYSTIINGGPSSVHRSNLHGKNGDSKAADATYKRLGLSLSASFATIKSLTALGEE